MRLSPTIFCFIFYLFFCFGTTSFAQNNSHLQTIDSILPITNEDDFNNTVGFFNEFINRVGFNQKFWEPSFLELFNQAKIWAESEGSQQNYLQAQFMLLMYHDNHLQNDEVILIAEELIEYPAFLKTKNSAYAYQALFNSYGRLGYYRQQIEILDQLIQLNEKHGYPVRPKTYKSSNDLGLIYYKLEQFDLARYNFEKQAEVFEDSKDIIRYASMLNNIGLTYKQQQQNDSALKYFKLAIKKLGHQTIKDKYYSINYQKYFKNVILSNIAYLEIFEGKFEEAETVFKKELASSKQVKIPSSIRQSYAKLAQLYYLQAKYDQAKKYTDSVLFFEKKFPDIQTKTDTKLLQAKLFLKNNEIDKGLELLDEVFHLKDSITKVKTEKIYSEAAAKYNYEDALNKLMVNQEIIKQKDKANKILIVLIISALIASIVFIILFRKAIKSNKLIKKQKLELATGILEKEKLLDEMHHRTKNNLQIVGGILELQSQKNLNSESYKLLKESQQYLESIAILHKMLYEHNTYEDIDFETYTENLCHLIISNYPKKDIKYHLEITQQIFPVGLLTSLGLILCELLTNSLKHAFNNEGNIYIKHIKSMDTHQIVYRDNGKTFDKEKLLKSKGTGLKLIKSLSQDLEGKYEIQNKNGFYYQLTFTL